MEAPSSPAGAFGPGAVIRVSLGRLGGVGTGGAAM